MAGYVERRGENSWRLVVSAGRGPDGKRLRFTKTICASSRREAEKRLAEFIAEVNGGLLAEPGKMSFKHFAERFMRDYAEPRLAPKTVWRYRQLLEKHILPQIGHLKMDQVRPLHIIELHRTLEEKNLAPRTVLHVHRLVANILQRAVEWQVIAVNPARRVRAPSVPRRTARVYDENQVARLLEALEEEPLKYRTAVYLALASGLRLGELCGLEWQDIDFEAGTLTVARASQWLPGRGVFTKEPKTEESKRTIALPASVLSLLRRYKAQQNEERLKCGELWRGSGRILTTWNGGPVRPETVSQWFKRFLQRHGLPKITFHGLRHTSASLLICDGVPLKVVSERLGHTTIRTTSDIYGHLLKRADTEAAQRLDKYFLHPAKTKKEPGA